MLESGNDVAYLPVMAAKLDELSAFGADGAQRKK